jgi:tetraacyldisaccharide 4'-kinase
MARDELASRGFAAAPGWLNPVQWPLAALYWLAVQFRAAAYRHGWIEPRHAGRPVISVGNLTVGGSGKTPFTDYLLREAARAGLRPACLSRGYGRTGRSRVGRVRVADGMQADPAALGDEPSLLAQRNPAVPVYVGADRFDAARLAEVLDHPDIFILDDGYQHLRLARDLDVLLIDAEQGLGNGRTLPVGPLREPLAAIGRADVIVISKANLGDANAVRRYLVDRLRVRQPVFQCDYRPGRLTRLDGGRQAPVSALAGAAVSLVCGIAQPEGFRRSVVQAGATVRELLVHPDHHSYSSDDRAHLDARLKSAHPDRPEWITTEKDATKLRGRLAHADRMWVLEMEVVAEPAAQAFFFDSLGRLAIK